MLGSNRNEVGKDKNEGKGRGEEEVQWPRFLLPPDQSIASSSGKRHRQPKGGKAQGKQADEDQKTRQINMFGQDPMTYSFEGYHTVN